MRLQLDEPATAHLLLHLVVTVVDHHHRRARDLGQVVVRTVRALGSADERPHWVPLVSAYDHLASALVEHMHEEEELVLERVQLLHAQRRLRFGALAPSATGIAALDREHESLRHHLMGLRDRLGLLPDPTMAATPQVNAITTFASAVEAHLAFEEQALAPILEPFLLEARS